MSEENNSRVEAGKRCEFGVLAEVLQTLQREELEQTETCQVEIPETNIKQNTTQILTEINETLKEIVAMQKMILAEIQKNRTEETQKIILEEIQKNRT
jgi:hypothetical protein